jgi:hypothetical protein
MNQRVERIIIGSVSGIALQWRRPPPPTKFRAELFAAAEYYLHLGEVEGNLTASKSEPGHVPQI